MANRHPTAKSISALDDPHNYLNRELGALAFQRRVFEEAQDERNPLLERIKFIAIVGSNLDEFFMVRVGGLNVPAVRTPDMDFAMDDESPAEQLVAIRKAAQELMENVYDFLRGSLLPELHQAGINICDYSELNEAQQQAANSYFANLIFPVLTPLAVDPGHPFPHISNLSLNLAILVKGTGEQVLFARLKIPDTLPYLVPVPADLEGGDPNSSGPQHYDFVWVSQVILANLAALFPGMQILEAHPFYVNRSAEIELQPIETLDLMETMEESVRQRRFSPVVRLLVDQRLPRHVLDILIENLDIESEDIYTVHGPLVLRNLMQLYRLDRPDLKYRPFSPAKSSLLKAEGEEFFAAIRQGDILLHHPYDSFAPVIHFLEVAARDPNVLAIKQTLYRVGSNSPVVKTLLEASRDYGKQVAVLVELKARFDEESNIGWARMLEQEGVHVTYGLLGLKTHSKVALVVRKEEGRIRRYMHLATGNYNHVTAQLYEDLGLFTCDDDIGADATDLFNYLTGYSRKDEYHKLLVAPLKMRAHLEALIRREIGHQAAGQEGHIIIKVNALVDKPMVRLLYQASQAGVKIDLIVRGACSLRPGVAGLSENIRVTSILGRFLEHSRIYYFRNTGLEKIYLGSADLMPRNLNQRVEVLFPVEAPNLVQHIRDDILNIILSDNVGARLMLPDGSYQRIVPAPGEPVIDSQEWFMKQRL
ncbi:MAG: polyphosphate kinase 1 [Anaerolineaceae bacterium]|nr:polyphosphate kinase 1 [Anaerolineaceae bacterium]